MRKITKTVCIALTGCLAAAALAGCGSETKTVLELHITTARNTRASFTTFPNTTASCGVPT